MRGQRKDEHAISTDLFSDQHWCPVLSPESEAQKVTSSEPIMEPQASETSLEAAGRAHIPSSSLFHDCHEADDVVGMKPGIPVAGEEKSDSLASQWTASTMLDTVFQLKSNTSEKPPAAEDDVQPTCGILYISLLELDVPDAPEHMPIQLELRARGGPSQEVWSSAIVEKRFASAEGRSSPGAACALFSVGDEQERILLTNQATVVSLAPADSL